jgi:hypothetical protein
VKVYFNLLILLAIFCFLTACQDEPKIDFSPDFIDYIQKNTASRLKFNLQQPNEKIGDCVVAKVRQKYKDEPQIYSEYQYKNGREAKGESDVMEYIMNQFYDACTGKIIKK